MNKGAVKFYNVSEGFGFIGDNGSKEDILYILLD